MKVYIVTEDQDLWSEPNAVLTSIDEVKRRYPDREWEPYFEDGDVPDLDGSFWSTRRDEWPHEVVVYVMDLDAPRGS